MAEQDSRYTGEYEKIDHKPLSEEEKKELARLKSLVQKKAGDTI